MTAELYAVGAFLFAAGLCLLLAVLGDRRTRRKQHDIDEADQRFIEGRNL